MQKNRLQFEHSPYLLQHAENPVDWYPWGEAAFEKAKAEHKPVLVSIGYAACHWCHVMEKESFEDVDTATFMNAHFVNIKVDREERPDVDQLYMDAVQLLTGQGGWPLNVFLTPDKKPFYGGTYFPLHSHYGRPSWMKILNAIHVSWEEQNVEILEQTDLILQHLQQINIQERKTEILPFQKKDFDAIASKLLDDADAVNGGFGAAPKFLQTFSLRFLLEYYFATQEQDALQQVLFSLDKMIAGGIYDQLGGGIARYSTDKEWLVPHFEKMLYDNALFLEVLADAYLISGKQAYANVIEQTIAFCKSSLSKEGSGIGFYSSLDADSEGEEGKFYVWDEQEILPLLSKKYEQKIKEYWDISAEGNWEGKTILNYSNIDKDWITETLKELPDFFIELEEVKTKLCSVRSQRVAPRLDNKILLSWNALMVVALVKCAQALDRPDWLELAKQNMDFLLEKFFDGKDWYRSLIFDNVKIRATLEDMAYLIKALLVLGEQSINYEYILKAASLLEWVNLNFSDETKCFYYFSSKTQEDILVRKIDTYDGVIPSVNAVMAENLLILSKWLEQEALQERCNAMLASMSSKAKHYPGSFAYCCSVLLRNRMQQTLVVDKDFEISTQMIGQYLPFLILAHNEKRKDKGIALIHKEYKEGFKYYLCNQQSCEAPTNDLNKIIFKIKIEKMLE
ncbi:MAG TPA: thioredoxin domain-containing protein [Edaphocola sp.]|nr:thioredoxin domain-containing protein [Edaphocola sp.]